MWFLEKLPYSEASDTFIKKRIFNALRNCVLEVLHILEFTFLSVVLIYQFLAQHFSSKRIKRRSNFWIKTTTISEKEHQHYITEIRQSQRYDFMDCIMCNVCKNETVRKTVAQVQRNAQNTLWTKHRIEMIISVIIWCSTWLCSYATCYTFWAYVRRIYTFEWPVFSDLRENSEDILIMTTMMALRGWRNLPKLL